MSAGNTVLVVFLTLVIRCFRFPIDLAVQCDSIGIHLMLGLAEGAESSSCEKLSFLSRPVALRRLSANLLER